MNHCGMIAVRDCDCINLFRINIQYLSMYYFSLTSFVHLNKYLRLISGGLCALSGVFILTLPIPIVVNSFAQYYKNR